VTPEEVESVARAIDRLVFHDRTGAQLSEPPSAVADLVSRLNDSFPLVPLPPERRERALRRLLRDLAIPSGASPSAWERLEFEMNRRFKSLDPRWVRVAGTAALVVLGLAGIAYWRQRSTVKPVPATIR